MLPSLTILCYHRIVKDDDIEASWPYFERGTAVRQTTFRTQVDEITRFADVVSEQLALDVLAGHGTLSRPAVWLTFDDGYRDVLNAMGPDVIGTVFISSCIAERSLPADLWYDTLLSANRRRGFLDLGLGPFAYDLSHRDGRSRLVNGPERRTYLRSLPSTQSAMLDVLAKQLDAEVWGSNLYLIHKDIQQLLTAGWSLGSHGVTHTPFEELSTEEVVREALDSRDWISAFDVQASSIALPDGSLPQEPIDLHSCGYRCVLGLGGSSTRSGLAVQPRFIVPDKPHWISGVLQPTLEAESQ